MEEKLIAVISETIIRIIFSKIIFLDTDSNCKLRCTYLENKFFIN